MRLSGFSFVRNGVKLGYPVVESILSILPICDEFVIAVGKSDDGTLEKIKELNDSRIKIIETEWDPKLFVKGAINAVQTNIALSRCTGDWCFYLQADEVVHEKYLPVVVKKLRKYLKNPEVEGFLFSYIHFWGSYKRYQKARNWYRREVRIIRNHMGIKSWQSAQGFRKNGKKLKVIDSGAYVYHYGWVRPPRLMKQKIIALDRLHHSEKWIKSKHHPKSETFDYGSPRNLAIFRGTHPKVMEHRIKSDPSHFSNHPSKVVKHPHDSIWMRFRTFLEDEILNYRIGEYKNYILLKE
ncbi:MAG: glycosyltransferase [Fidelibacterota bacterium]